MQALLAPLKELADYEEITKKRSGTGMVLLTNCNGSQKTHMMYSLSDGFTYKIIAFSSAEKANSFYEEYRFLSDSVFLYPAKDMLFYHADIKGKYLLQKRMEVIRGIFEGAEDGMTIVTTIDAFMDGLPERSLLEGKVLTVENGKEVELQKLEKSTNMA